LEPSRPASSPLKATKTSVRLGRSDLPRAARELEHHGDAAGVVVGAGMQFAFVAGANIGPAATEVVVVGPEHDALGRQLGSVPGMMPMTLKSSAFASILSLACGCLEVLEPRAVVGTGLQSSRRELLGDPATSRAQSMTAEAATAVLLASEFADVCEHARAIKGRRKLRERATLGSSPRATIAGADFPLALFSVRSMRVSGEPLPRSCL
jgi:hypothetical protein